MLAQFQPDHFRRQRAHHNQSKNLLIKSGYVKLRSSALKPLKELFLEIYPQRLQMHYDYDKDVELVSLSKYWIAASSTVQGYAGFELSASEKVFHFAVPNYYEVDSWISAIKQAAKIAYCGRSKAMSMPDSRDYDEEVEDTPSSLGQTCTMPPIGQHSWYVKAFTKPTYCNICRQSLATFQRTSLCCQICKVKIHKRCAENCQLDCKWTTLQSCGENVVIENNETKMCHQWVEGNLPFGIRCCVCSKKCGSLLRLQDFRCIWCRIAIHSSCLASNNNSSISKLCTFDQCRLSVLPPTAVRARDGGSYQAVKPLASSPLIVFINLKSGSHEGSQFMRRFRQLLNPVQVNSLTLEGAAPGLLLCSSLDSFRVLICGGDGSISWVLSEIDKLGLVNRCHIGILPLGTGNDMSRVLGWGSAVSIKQDVSDIIKQMEQAQIKMLDRWSILSYAFPTSSDRGEAGALAKSADDRSTPRSRRSPLAFILRLEDQISSQLDDLNRLCAKVIVNLPVSDANVRSNSELYDEIRKRIGILPDLVHSYVTSIMSIGSSQRCSQTISAEVTTACDTIECRVQDLVRCWALLQSRPLAVAINTDLNAGSQSLPVQGTPSTNRAHPQINNPVSQPPNYQQFLRPPQLSPTPDFDSGCSSDFDIAEDIPAKHSMARLSANTSALVRTMSSVNSPPNLVGVLTSVIRHLQMIIPQLSRLLVSNIEAASSSSNFRTICLSTGDCTDDEIISSPSKKHQHRNEIKSCEAEDGGNFSVPIPLSQAAPKAQSCGALTALSDLATNFGDSGCSVDETFAVGSPSTTVAARTTSSPQANLDKVDASAQCRSLPFEKQTPKGRANRKGGFFPWCRSNVTSASSCTHLAPPATPANSSSVSPKSPKKDLSSTSSSSSSAAASAIVPPSRSPIASTSGPADTGFIRQMLYSSARTLSSVCRQLMIPDPSLLHVTPASAPFEERCVMNNYFGIGLDARIALDFHIRREEAPESCKSRAKNFAWFGVLGTKQFVQQTYRNLEQRVQLECDGERLLLPSLQGIVILNIPSYMGGVNFWGSSRATHGFKAPSFDDHLLEVVAIFGSAQMAASRVIRLHHHRIAQCRSVRITILDRPLPVQVDGEAWLHPPGVIVIQHKNRAQMLARDLDFVEVLRAWHRSSSNANYDQTAEDGRHIHHQGRHHHNRNHRKGTSVGEKAGKDGGCYRRSGVFQTEMNRVTSPVLEMKSSSKQRSSGDGCKSPISRSSSDVNCAYSHDGNYENL